MKRDGDIMKDCYELKGPPRKNPYAENIKKHGFSVSINYETPADIDEDMVEGTIRSLLKEPGLNSIRLNIQRQTETESA